MRHCLWSGKEEQYTEVWLLGDSFGANRGWQRSERLAIFPS